MNISYASISDVGDRQNNEDSLGILTEPSDVSSGSSDTFFALADGLGGHGQGEVASQLAVQAALTTHQDAQANHGDTFVLDACFLSGQEAIMLEQQQQNAQGEMKTTLVLLSISAKTAKAQWGHIGDSRLYWFVGNRLRLRTLDHSVPQMLVQTGEIREKDIRKHEDRNRLLRVMGTEWSSPRYEIADAVALTGKDSFLLCTDGFWEYVSEKVMQRSLNSAKTANAWLQSMLQEAGRNSRGSNRDNYSAITVFVR